MESQTKGETSRESGFTLIAVSILGILAIIVIPNFLGWLPRSPLKGGGRKLYSNLQRARLHSITTNSQQR